MNVTVDLMESIVISAGHMRKEAEIPKKIPDIIGGYLCVRDAVKDALEFLFPIGNIQDHWNRNLFLSHAQNRARLIQESPKTRTSAEWGKENIGAIRASHLILSFSSTLPDHLTEACTIALAWHTKPRLLDDSVVESILKQSGNPIFIGQFLSITRPEEDRVCT